MTKDRQQKTSHDRARSVPLVVVALCIALSACAPAPGAPDPLRENVTLVTSVTSISKPTQATATMAPTSTRVPATLTPSSTPTPTATATPPKPITMVIVGEPETLHPLYAASRAAQTVLGALFVGCIGQNEAGAPVALGCESVPTIDNGGAHWVGDGNDRHLEATFKIREGWRWTDGQPVTSQDALFSWRAIMSPAAQVRDPLTQKVYAMTAPDARTVVVSFMSAAQARLAAVEKLRGDVSFEYFARRGDYAAYEQQDGPLADPNYWGVVRWLPEHLLKDVPPAQQLTDLFAAKPVGDGAFELTAWNKGSDLTLTRSSKPFPLPNQGKIPAITFKFAKDEAGAALMMKSGEAQLAEPLAYDLVGAPLVITPVVAPLVEQIVLNTERTPFDSVKVRQAVQLAVNTADIMRDPAVGTVTVSQVIDPSGMFYAQDNVALLTKTDGARAKGLLEEAGWSCNVLPCTREAKKKSGGVVTETLGFTLATNQREPRNAVSQIIQKQLAAAGFAVDVQIMSGLGGKSKLFASYDEGGILLTRNFDAALYQAQAFSRFSGVFGCSDIPSEKSPQPTQGNVYGYCDKATDAAILAAESGDGGVTASGRAKAIGAVFTAITRNALFVPLYSPLRAFASHGINGLKYSGFGVATWNAWEWN
jgi:ABC-type transport system substrate-binding protein